jgi:hypothetical protein
MHPIAPPQAGKLGHLLDRVMRLRTQASELLRTDSFAEIELRSKGLGAEAPHLYYLGRQSLFSQFIFLVGSQQPFETCVVRAGQFGLPGFLRKRLRLQTEMRQKHLICVIDAVLLNAAAAAALTPCGTLYTPQLRSTLKLAQARQAPAFAGLHLVTPGATVPQGIGLHVGRSFEDFELFYDHLYAPYGRTVGLPLLRKDIAWRTFEASSRSCGARLLILKNGRTPICGAWVGSEHRAKETLEVQHLGVMRPDLLAKATLQARRTLLEAEIVRYAREAGYAFLDFGHLPADPRHPAHASRQALGCTLSRDRHAPLFALHIPACVATAVLRRSPLWVEQADAFVTLRPPAEAQVADR